MNPIVHGLAGKIYFNSYYFCGDIPDSTKISEMQDIEI
jgi:hypothetical protein